MKKKTIIGCSAYNNTYWKGIFYPGDLPRTKWFDYYCRHFNTYEMNGTFYKPPTVKSLKSWYGKVPEGFMFSVKAPKNITHYKRFNDCKAEVDVFYAICHEGLQEKLACVLFQLPPSFQYSAERLENIISHLDSGFNNVIEFRHESWWIPEVFAALKQANITFCNVSYPMLPERIIETASIGYIRLHGTPKLFYSEYKTAYLEYLMEEIANAASIQTVYVYFNNTASTAGILNAMEMEKLVEK